MLIATFSFIGAVGSGEIHPSFQLQAFAETQACKPAGGTSRQLAR
jgi:hypothetical protein